MANPQPGSHQRALSEPGVSNTPCRGAPPLGGLPGVLVEPGVPAAHLTAPLLPSSEARPGPAALRPGVRAPEPAGEGLLRPDLLRRRQPEGACVSGARQGLLSESFPWRGRASPWGLGWSLAPPDPTLSLALWGALSSTSCQAPESWPGPTISVFSSSLDSSLWLQD